MQGFVKVVKNKAYFMRYQVKFARRRKGLTDYRQRQRLIHVDKNKYQVPKYRLVVRLTNRFVLCQIVYATLSGDKTLCQASSRELPRYGVKLGLKNYAAAYCTGLLVARRLLAKLGLAEIYEGTTEVDGEVHTSESVSETGKKRKHFLPEVSDERRPFRCYLDVGVRPTTTGARIFGALKGASDGGLDIPHNHKRFPGYSVSEDGAAYNAEVHRDHIFGKHVADYMSTLLEEDEEAYTKQFGLYKKAGIKPDDLEGIYEEAHKRIRADPSPAPKKAFTPDKKFKNKAKKSLAERKDAVKEKLSRRIEQLRAVAQDYEEDDDDVESD